jgi:hypothetical protein
MKMATDATLRESIGSQFSASLEMLAHAIEMCPHEHWNTETNFWYMAFHCLFWTDYYLTTDPAKFTPPAPFTFSEFDPSGKKPDRVYTKLEIQTYLEHCKQKASGLLSELTVNKLEERWINDYKNYSLLEIILYNCRHIQHHSAQLNLILRQTINNAPAWVSKV